MTFTDIGAVPAAWRPGAVRPRGGIVLRPAQLADRPALATIAAAAFAQGVAVLLPPELRARADAARFTCFLAATPGVLLLAEVDGVPVGCALATLPAANDPPARLQGLWVAPGRTGQGIGSALLAAMEETLGRQGVASLRVRVPSGQLRALGLFRRRGYALRTAGLRPEPVLEAMLRHSVLAKPLLAAAVAA
ncbi:GNAT family N-acetyltransferase [Roseomonas haemaphysalidis]|uniref:GNAT family N-acetyltransferase n=1 Tax=Roseomonas haemaphysalidis TaxID=2768162 RepID=A0ABS3KS53_9PROT|nr:GNAT family N-acetyltransferase [Roseomonas haemaphysalidis]MBO1080296.1 GNAT family N-acetyltransferase [Roseomonas haemaphysalidis]